MTGTARTEPSSQTSGLVLRILLTISVCHFLNDMIQSLIPAIYPILKTSFHLSFSQIGLITLTGQLTASLLQPMVGLYTDRRPQPFSLPVGMGFTLTGLLMLSTASSFPLLLLAVGMVGVGSSVLHPESSRVARVASGGQHGLAQAVFQVGGNGGGAVGPLLAAFIILPRGQGSIAWFAIAALLAMGLLTTVGVWYRRHGAALRVLRGAARDVRAAVHDRRVAPAVCILMALMFSKYFYLASLTSYYTFYLITRFHVPVRSAQVHLFAFLGAVAAGTLIGGPVGDRIGRKAVIWGSILGVLPFTLLLPHANLFWTGVLTVVIGLILASAFPAILVYAQELIPGKIGTISGLFFGLAFGLGGIGAALLGRLADRTSIVYVYQVCAFLPAIGLLAGFLPNMTMTEGGPPARGARSSSPLRLPHSMPGQSPDMESSQVKPGTPKSA
jgi:FSR family fosmidomycin resistance protein-like MFS transporter